MSKREIYAYTSIASTICLLGFYVITVFGWPESIPDVTSQLSSLFIKVLFFAFIIELLLGLLKRKNEVEKDERDLLFEAKGFKNAYLFLTTMVILILSQILISTVIGSDKLGFFDFNGNPFHIFHSLVIILSISSLINRGTQIFYYNRGY